MSITEHPSPLLSPKLGGKHPNSHAICVSPMQKSIDKALQFVHQRIALFFIRTPSNNNDKHSLFIGTFLDSCERTDIAVRQRPTSCVERTQLNTFLACYSTEYMTATVFKMITPLSELKVPDNLLTPMSSKMFMSPFLQSQIIFQSQLI